MMPLSEFLVDFSSKPVEHVRVDVGDEEALESLRLEAFETGYKAGWEDAVKARNEDRSHISDEFSQSLQDLSFTYHEAYSHVVGATAPLLEQIVLLLLPEMARHALGLHVVEQLQEMSRRLAAQEVEILVSPENEATMDWLVDGDFGFRVSLVGDPALTNGQASLRFANSEKSINLDEVIAGVEASVQGFLHENKKEVVNG